MTAAGGQGNITIANGAAQNFTVTVSDINMNTLIGGSTLACAATAQTGGTTALIGKATFKIPDSLSSGPLTFTLGLSNTTVPPQLLNYAATLSCDITWNSIVYTMSYPGTITLIP